MDLVSRIKQLPPAPPPNNVPADIKGNMSLENKRLGSKVFAYHIAHYPDSRVFGHEALANMKFAETYIRRVGMGEQNELVGEDETPEVLRTLPLEGQTVCEITAEEGECWKHGLGIACIY